VVSSWVSGDILLRLSLEALRDTITVKAPRWSRVQLSWRSQVNAAAPKMAVRFLMPSNPGYATASSGGYN